MDREREEQRKQGGKAWKLLVDPNLKPGMAKLTRYEGVCPGSEHQNVQHLQDPRNPAIARMPSRSIDLEIPQFRIDDEYVGTPPPREVTFTDLNDNVSENFLRDLCKKIGDVEEVAIFTNPVNKRHLGIAKVTFKKASFANVCIKKHNNSTIMGALTKVFIDPLGEKAKLLVSQLLHQQAPAGSVSRKGSSELSRRNSSANTPPVDTNSNNLSGTSGVPMSNAISYGMPGASMGYPMMNGMQMDPVMMQQFQQMMAQQQMGIAQPSFFGYPGQMAPGPSYASPQFPQTGFTPAPQAPQSAPTPNSTMTAMLQTFMEWSKKNQNKTGSGPPGPSPASFQSPPNQGPPEPGPPPNGDFGGRNSPWNRPSDSSYGGWRGNNDHSNDRGGGRGDFNGGSGGRSDFNGGSGGYGNGQDRPGGYVAQDQFDELFKGKAKDNDSRGGYGRGRGEWRGSSGDFRGRGRGGDWRGRGDGFRGRGRGDGFRSREGFRGRGDSFRGDFRGRGRGNRSGGDGGDFSDSFDANFESLGESKKSVAESRNSGRNSAFSDDFSSAFSTESQTQEKKKKSTFSTTSWGSDDETDGKSSKMGNQVKNSQKSGWDSDEEMMPQSGLKAAKNGANWSDEDSGTKCRVSKNLSPPRREKTSSGWSDEESYERSHKRPSSQAQEKSTPPESNKKKTGWSDSEEEESRPEATKTSEPLICAPVSDRQGKAGWPLNGENNKIRRVSEPKINDSVGKSQSNGGWSDDEEMTKVAGKRDQPNTKKQSSKGGWSDSDDENRGNVAEDRTGRPYDPSLSQQPIKNGWSDEEKSIEGKSQIAHSPPPKPSSCSEATKSKKNNSSWSDSDGEEEQNSKQSVKTSCEQETMRPTNNWSDSDDDGDVSGKRSDGPGGTRKRSSAPDRSQNSSGASNDQNYGKRQRSGDGTYNRSHKRHCGPQTPPPPSYETMKRPKDRSPKNGTPVGHRFQLEDLSSDSSENETTVESNRHNRKRNPRGHQKVLRRTPSVADSLSSTPSDPAPSNYNTPSSHSHVGQMLDPSAVLAVTQTPQFMDMCQQLGNFAAISIQSCLLSKLGAQPPLPAAPYLPPPPPPPPPPPTENLNQTGSLPVWNPNVPPPAVQVNNAMVQPPGYPDGLTNSPDVPAEPAPMIIDLQQRSVVLIDQATDMVLNDLKMILLKDLSKRVVELTQFAIFDKWLQKQHFSGANAVLTKLERPVQPVDAIPSKPLIAASNVESMPVMLNRLFEKSDDKWGFGFGLKAAMPKLPSFKKKFIPPSPPSSAHEDSDQEEEAEEKAPSDNESDRRSVGSSQSSHNSQRPQSSSSDVSVRHKRKLRRKLSSPISEPEDSQSETEAKSVESGEESEVVASEKISESSDAESEDTSEEEEGSEEEHQQMSVESCSSVDESDADDIKIIKTICPEFKDTNKTLASESAAEPIRFWLLDHDYTPKTESDLPQSENDRIFAIGKLSPAKRPGKKTSVRAVRDTVEDLPVFVKPKPVVPRKPLPSRSPLEETKILFDFLQHNVDEEDLQMFRLAYEALLEDECHRELLSQTHCRDLASVSGFPVGRRMNSSPTPGCTRTTGFYRVTMKEKKKSISRRVFTDEDVKLRPKDVNVNLKVNVPVEKVRQQVQSNREARSMQRRLLTSLGEVESDLLNFNQLKYRKKLIRFGRSHIHNWGLFAMQDIVADEMIVEYVGQKVRINVADTREKTYEKMGIGSSYLFRMDNELVIDATKMGNLARFINHSCMPNCYAKVISVNGEKKIVIYSKDFIRANEEITYDYKFPIEDNKLPCFCGSANCKGSLN